ncbi:putative fungal specific transcription factor domain-containing protein [Eutypa lata UCREL1]|uniref:Putative fungal specific transcription factor domain-containing protein n=1 Tax=Eutypa lata (strain UCR-EL1) TaxID=1287681 RepID=M7TTL8_EUTLA|nr:putative fungal specific transcription factor domain-containing protein [Eutypa lata UCREL1]
MNSLAAGHHDLLALQVLLGLVMLNLGTLGLSTASSLIGSAIKLAHKLRLHNSRTNALLDDATSLQRARVFWIAYILDRDISFRRCDPPLQQENDHDIAVPYSSQGRGLVRFVTASGAEVYLDLFQTWVNLARIQGDIYEQLYSVRAETQPLDTQRRNKDLIHLMLREWLATIPAELHPDRFSGLSPEPAAGQLVVLYFTYLACFLQTHRVGSHDAEWIARLVNYTSALVLIANALTVSEHRCSADTDAQLIAEALAFFERSTALVPGCVGFRKMHAACAELSCRARIARARFALDLGGPSKPASVAWLEAEARRSAGHSALALVEAFTTAEVKPFGAAVVAGRISAPT